MGHTRRIASTSATTVFAATCIQVALELVGLNGCANGAAKDLSKTVVSGGNYGEGGASPTGGLSSAEGGLTVVGGETGQSGFTNTLPALNGGTVTMGGQSTGTVTFVDEFNGSSLDPASWALLDREDGEGNADYYTPKDASVSGGTLNVLTKLDKSFPNLNYSSAEVQWRTFNLRYGTIEIRAKLAGGKGTWPALWLLGHNCQVTNLTTPANVGTCNWPAPGSDEIDIAEVLGSNPTSVNQQLHSNGHDDGCHASVNDSSATFHTYQLVWSPGSLVWKIDGAKTCAVSAAYVPNTPMYLVINTAVGVTGAGSIDNSTFPQKMSVDYVRVTQ